MLQLVRSIWQPVRLELIQSLTVYKWRLQQHSNNFYYNNCTSNRNDRICWITILRNRYSNSYTNRNCRWNIYCTCRCSNQCRNRCNKSCNQYAWNLYYHLQFTIGACSNMATTSITITALPTATIAYRHPILCNRYSNCNTDWSCRWNIFCTCRSCNQCCNRCN